VDLEVTELGSGPQRVVFVHGVLDRGRSFARVAEELDAECRMCWYDRRGYGSSAGAPGAPVGVDGHIDDLLAVLGDEPAVVVGHSFGGVSVVGAAIRAPELVQAVVLYETGMAWIPGWDDRFLRDVLWGEDPEGNGLRLLFGDRMDAMAPEQRARRRLEAQAFVAEERSVRTGRPPYDLGGLRAPLVYGSSPSYHFPVVAEHLAAVTPHVEAITIDEAGHNAHRSAPAAFAGLVRRGIELARARA
jgi:pimeloyl-ACP methyl ester carboxylesterase